MRQCNFCDFKVQVKHEGLAGVSEEMVVMTDHLMVHNPQPDQWHDAHEKIQAAKEKTKGKGKEE